LPGGITKISYPKDHPRLPGLSLSATVVNLLSFFNLVFLPLVLSLVSIALPAQVISSLPIVSFYSFPHVQMDSVLWHRRFGHVGIEATKAVLTKDYVMGVHFDGPFLWDHCIPCLVSKSPQCSYSYHGHRATLYSPRIRSILLYPVTWIKQQLYIHLKVPVS
jgi:hypothetical protein